MRTLTKEQISPDTRPAAVGQGWELFLPYAIDEQDLADLSETRAALRQAEVVIRAQEDRIRLLQELALTDELTGLTNRRGFTLAFEREMALARRDVNYSGMLVMIDLDGFKSINDTWGHQVGDAYLCTVAQTLRDGLRSTDTVARLGGDEFALLLTHLDEKTGLQRLEKLEHDFNKCSMMMNEALPLRASFGCAAYAGSDKAAAVMHAADLRLYERKSRGKILIRS